MIKEEINTQTGFPQRIWRQTPKRWGMPCHVDMEGIFINIAAKKLRRADTVLLHIFPVIADHFTCQSQNMKIVVIDRYRMRCNLIHKVCNLLKGMFSQTCRLKAFFKFQNIKIIGY